MRAEMRRPLWMRSQRSGLLCSSLRLAPTRRPSRSRRASPRSPAPKIATYNVNGVNGRLPVLLDRLAEAGPDVVCLQELKAPQEKFPAAALRDAGYEAVWLGQKNWNGVAIPARGESPAETRRGLAGEPDPGQSRYIEATVDGILIGCACEIRREVA